MDVPPAFWQAGGIQLVVLLIVETLYAVYVIKTRQKYSAWDNYLLIFNRLSFPAYSVVKLFSFLPLGEGVKQNVIGLINGLVLIAILIVNTLYCLSMSLYILGRAIKDRKSTRLNSSH